MPPLTPDSKKFKAVGLLKQSQLKAVSLVEEIGSNKRYVAHQLKTPSTLSKDQAATRLAQEAAALEGVSHPNIPHFEGYLSTATGNWFLFEYLDGYPLSQHKGDTDKVPDEWVMWWFSQILATLDQLHQKDVVVGGFEPKHFLVHLDKLYLVHIGILENLFPETLALLRSPERLTFSAPEHRHSIKTSVTGDLYSAGAVAYWLCAGKAPSYGTHVPEDQVLAAILAVRPKFPPEVSRVITKLIQFQHQNRFQSASEPLSDIAPFVKDLKAATPPSPVRPYKVRFFGRETSARLTTEAVEAEKKASPPKAPAPGLAEALTAVTEGAVKNPLSQETMRPAPKPKGPLEVDTDKKLAAPAAATTTATAVLKEKDVAAAATLATEAQQGPSAFQEFVEDILWSTFKKSPIGSSLAVIGVVLVLIVGVWLFTGPSGTKEASPDVLTLVAGHIDVKVGNQAEWTTTQTVSTGESLVVATQRNSPTVLKFGHSGKLRLEDRTQFRYETLEGTTLKIRLVEGHAWVEPGRGDTTEVTVGVNQVIVPQDCSAEFTVGPGESGETHEPQVRSNQGTLQVKTMSGTTNLMAGNTMTLSDVPSASASPRSTESTSSDSSHL